MMRLYLLATALITGLITGNAYAASLRVSPVLIDLRAPAAASSLRVWNDSKHPVNVQVRIFRWSQKDGKDVFTPTRDVTVSPPMVSLKPGGENMVRVVRTSKQPVRAEESYRVIVDELPRPGQKSGGTVTLVIRHSIPVFFSQSEVTTTTPSFSIRSAPGGYEVTATNDGGRRIRLADMSLLSTGGNAIAGQQGLVGYVLGGSSNRWIIPSTGGKRAGGSLKISADTEGGKINAVARAQGG